MPEAESTIAIVEDDSRYRGYLQSVLESTPGFHCVGAYASADIALQMIATHPPEYLLLDLELSGLPGDQAIHEFRNCIPGLQIVVLTFHQDPQRLFASLEAGAAGYLIKPVDATQLVAALHEVRNGGAPMSGPIARMVLQSFHRRGAERREIESLTSRELAVLRAIATGALPDEVAGELKITLRTVQTHLRNVYQKLHVHSRSQAVAKFLERTGQANALEPDIGARPAEAPVGS